LDQSRNELLSRLSAEDGALLVPHLQDVPLALRSQLELPNMPIEHVYFIDCGMASVVAISATDERLEVGIIGREGMSGTTVVLGDDRSPHESFIQMQGSGQRIRADDLRDAMRESPTLHRLMMLYVQAFAIQTAHTALANGRSKLEERLARWLLMCHDRVDGDELPLTHEFLALMLGVRRTGVTLALHLLEGRGLIHSTRGRIVIADRAGLEETAGGSYGIPEAEYQRLMSQAAN
jgi:CRP-like cAMP-binding protein